VLELPNWSRFKVLAYKVPATTLLEVAVAQYDPEEREEFMAYFQCRDPRKRMAWIDKGVVAAMLYLREKAGIPFRLYAQRFLRGNPPGYLLSFCSSEVLEDDPSGEFSFERVKPLEKLERLLVYGSILGLSELPKWYTPDKAIIFS
jgi:hypothetical protein